MSSPNAANYFPELGGSGDPVKLALENLGLVYGAGDVRTGLLKIIGELGGYFLSTHLCT